MKATTLDSTSLAWRGSLLMQLMPRVARCQESLSSTSAMATLNRARTRSTTERRICLFPFRLSPSGKAKVIRQIPTCMTSSTQDQPHAYDAHAYPDQSYLGQALLEEKEGYGLGYQRGK